MGLRSTEAGDIEIALIERERQLREAQRLAQLGSWERDVATGRLTWSDEIFRIFEVDPTSFTVSFAAFVERVHPDDRELVREHSQRVVTSPEPREFAHRIVTPNGRIKHVVERGCTRFDADGRALRVTGTVQDVTARVEAEQRVARSEALFRTMFERAAVGVVLADVDGHWLTVNPAFCALVGYAPEEIVGTRWQRLTHPDDIASGETAARELREGTRATWTHEKRFLHKSGAIVWAKVSLSARHEDDAVVQIVAVVEDITERKRAEEAYRESEARRALIFEHTSDIQALFAVEPNDEFRIVMANESFLRRARLRNAARVAEGLAGTTLRDLVLAVWAAPPSRYDYLSSVFARARDRRERVSFESVVSHGGEHPMIFDVTIVPVVDDRGRCTHLLYTSRDATAERLAARRLAEQLEQKEVLLREVHHRVKNNLQIVTSLLSLQQQRARSEEVVELLRTSASRIAAMALVHERLYAANDFSRIDVGAYVRDLAGRLHSSFGLDRQRIALEVEGSFSLELDRAIVCGLLLNEVLSNSFKHAFADDGAGKVRVVLGQDAGALTITMTDDGRGFSPGEKAAEGTLGLRLLPKLAAQIEGTLERMPPPGTGYRLRFAAHPERR